MLHLYGPDTWIVFSQSHENKYKCLIPQMEGVLIANIGKMLWSLEKA